MRTLGRESNTITISVFYENYILDKYNFNPACQRKSVWNEERESFLIDSIMKNFSIPPIFLHQKINDENGKTIYDVIDGKQRLTSIIKFIENKITLPDDYSADDFGDERLNGLKFEDLKDDLSEYKKNFWRYNIPVEYIDTEDEKTINAVFDRLNRNGIPLNPQELRNAKYNNTNLMSLVNELSKINFWNERFTNSDRMEDKEFISELILVMLENEIFNANLKDIDNLYEKYKDIDSELSKEIATKFIKVTEDLNNLNLDYKKYNLGVSHIYALWCFCFFSFEKNIQVQLYKESIDKLYIDFRDSKAKGNEGLEKYRDSISRGGSKSKSQRRKRVQAIFDYCGITINI